MSRFVLAAALATALSGSAFAQSTTTTTQEYYVVQDASTKKCTIVDKKPVTTETTIVGDGKVFTTRTEAETGMKSVKVCTTN